MFLHDTNELIYKTETDSKMLKKTYGYQTGGIKGGERYGLAHTHEYM